MASPLERGLADLWRRTAPPMGDEHRAQFRAAVGVMLDSWVWEPPSSPRPYRAEARRRRRTGRMSSTAAHTATVTAVDSSSRSRGATTDAAGPTRA